MIRFGNFPLPPSMNAAYANSPRGRIKTREARVFYSRVERWAWENREVVKEAVAELQVLRLRKPALFLRVDAVFYFKYSKIFCRDGSAKCNDTSNRIKLLHDAIARYLMVNDKDFWSGSFDKRPVHAEDQECVDVTISEKSELG